MKLTKTQLTPLVAISVALCAALSSFGGMKYSSVMSVPGFTDEEATLNDFPLLVRISSATIEGFAYDLCQADGKDIRFTSLDGATVYPHEIDEWNTDGESLVWVRIPALAKGCQFKFWFGDSSVTAAPAYTTNGAVWKGADYFGVYHMNETEGAGTASYLAYDSSTYGFDLTPKKGSGDLTQMVSAEGTVGRARKHSDSNTGKGNGLFAARSYDNLAIGDVFTVSGWFKLKTGAGGQNYLSHGWYIQNGNSTQIKVTGSGSTTYAVNLDDMTKGWVHLVIVYNGTTATVYSKGVRKGSGTIGAAKNNDKPLAVGNNIDQAAMALSGWQDEIRLRKGAVGDAWAKAEYECASAADYVTAAAVAAETVADTITVTSSSDYQRGTVSPAYGVSAIAAGTVTCTAPADPVDATETEKFLYTGWKLTQIAASGAATVTEGDGNVCEFTHTAGESVNLEWQHNRYYKIDATVDDPAAATITGCGFVGEGEINALTVTPAAGKEFKYWNSSAVLVGDRTANPYTFVVTAPLSFEAVTCDLRYRWKAGSDGKLTGNWNANTRWADLDGDGTGDIPPNDGTATVLLPATNTTYTITLGGDYKNVDIKGIYILSTPVFSGSSGNAITISSGSLTLREGGIEMDDSRNPLGIKFTCDLNIPVSQTWMNKCNSSSPDNSVNNNALTFNKKLTVAEDAVLTVAGTTPFGPNANNTDDFKGKIRTNCPIDYLSNNTFFMKATDGLFEVYADDTPYASVSTVRFLMPSATSYTITCPVKLSWADTAKSLLLKLQTVTTISGNAWELDWAGPISGVIADKKVGFGNVTGAGSQHRSHHPEYQRTYISGDNSGLDTTGRPAIIFPHGVITLRHANALGTGNVLGASFGPSDGTVGYFTGLTATNGIAIGSQMTLDKEGLAILLGMLDEGETTYTGSFTGNQKSQVFLHAVPNATAHFMGAFTMNNANNYSLEVTGGGTISLEGDNAQVNKKPLNVRAGTAVLGHANAAGTQPVNLGGEVPGEVTVRAVYDRTFSYEGLYTFTDAGPGNNTKTNFTYVSKSTKAVCDLVADDVTLTPGDLVLYTTDVADGSSGRIMRYHEPGKIGAAWLPYAAGLKVKVLDGTKFGGKTFMFTQGASAATATFSGAGNAVLDALVMNPDAKLLAKNGVTIANDINVTDNKSTGLSAIGSADASTVTFSGAITLAKDVFFEAAEGSTVNVTGTIDAGDFKVAGFSGLGTVNFANGLDVADQALQVVLQADAVPTEGLKKYTLATGLSGTPTAITLRAADGSAVPEGWNVHKVGSKLVFKNNLSGAAILIR